MSILGYLLAFAPGLAAKVRLPASDREKISEVEPLRERIGKLEYQLCDAENARDAAEAQLERHRAEAALDQRWREHVAYAQLMNAAMAQQQLAQQYQQLGGLGQQGFQQNQQNLFGAQNAYWRDCTCIPDRASALNPRPPDQESGG
jgi:hypothetical protein